MKQILETGLFILLIISPTAQAIDFPLLERIEQAQKHLSATEHRIANERQVIAKQLNRVEKEVLTLREKTAVAQRLADEKTLSLSTLKERLNSWQQQQVYQQNLLHRFIQSNDRQTDNEQSSDLATRLATATNVAEKLQKRFQPVWQSADIVLPSGEISSMPILGIGPVNWYWDASKERAGLASRHDNTSDLLHSDLLLSGSDNDAIASLLKEPSGTITFDPTLTRALARQQNAESLVQHIMKGGLWAIPIILFAIFALAIALVKANQLFRLPKLVRFTPTALKSTLEDASSPLSSTVTGMQKRLLTIAHNNSSVRQRDDQLFMQLQDDKHWLERWVGGIAITAAISPLLGLLGTVSGMIETFKMMTLFGSGDPEVVSGGIAQALITTELGLVVAIPALILNALLSRRAKTYYNELESFAILISKTDEGAREYVTDSPSTSKPIQANVSNTRNDIPSSEQGAIA